MTNLTTIVVEIRDAILNNSIQQSWNCDTVKGNGYGGFTNDPDGFNESSLYVAGDTWINDITDKKMIGESVECELIDPSNNIIDATSTNIYTQASIPPSGFGNAGNCIIFTNVFINTLNMPRE